MWIIRAINLSLFSIVLPFLTTGMSTANCSCLLLCRHMPLQNSRMVAVEAAIASADVCCSTSKVASATWTWIICWKEYNRMKVAVLLWEIWKTTRKKLLILRKIITKISYQSDKWNIFLLPICSGHLKVHCNYWLLLSGKRAAMASFCWNSILQTSGSWKGRGNISSAVPFPKATPRHSFRAGPPSLMNC